MPAVRPESVRVIAPVPPIVAVAGAPTRACPTLVVGARACPLEPNDARLLAAELPDAFGDVAADMRRAAPAVSKGIEVALEDLRDAIECILAQRRRNDPQQDARR